MSRLTSSNEIWLFLNLFCLNVEARKDKLANPKKGPGFEISRNSTYGTIKFCTWLGLSKQPSLVLSFKIHKQILPTFYLYLMVKMAKTEFSTWKLDKMQEESSFLL